MSTESTSPRTSDPMVIARIAAGRDKYKREATRLATEKAEGDKAIAELRKQLEGLQPAGDRVKELEGQLRTLKHRTAFDRLAKESGAKDKALDTLFRESGYRADADEADEKAIKAALAKLRDSHDFAFEAQAEGDEEGEEKPREEARTIAPAPSPAPDAGRGKRHDGKGTAYITRELLADPKWALDPKNAELKRTAKVKG